MSRIVVLLVGLMLPMAVNANDLEVASDYVLAELTGISQSTSPRSKKLETYKVSFIKFSFQDVAKIQLVPLSHPAASGQDYAVMVILQNTGNPVTTDIAQEVTEEIHVAPLGTPHRFFPINRSL